MYEKVETLLSKSLEGHRAITKIHAGSPDEEFFKRIALLHELKKRGVRFLPAQVIKRAMRQLKHTPSASH